MYGTIQPSSRLTRSGRIAQDACGESTGCVMAARLRTLKAGRNGAAVPSLTPPRRPRTIEIEWVRVAFVRQPPLGTRETAEKTLLQPARSRRR